jgi:hypothetical protein
MRDAMSSSTAPARCTIGVEASERLDRAMANAAPRADPADRAQLEVLAAKRDALLRAIPHAQAD